MLQVTGVSLQYGSKKLFEDVNLKFTKGNCYGIIGANGAGKSTFLKVLSGEIEPQKGFVSLDKNERMSVLQQNQNMYDDETVLRTVMLGYKKLVSVMDEKDALYAKPDFSEEDGIRAAELESEFAEMNGYDAEYQAGQLLNALEIGEEWHYALMSDLDAKNRNSGNRVVDFPKIHTDKPRHVIVDDNRFRALLHRDFHFFLERVSTTLYKYDFSL